MAVGESVAAQLAEVARAAVVLGVRQLAAGLKVADMLAAATRAAAVVEVRSAKVRSEMGK